MDVDRDVSTATLNNCRETTSAISPFEWMNRTGVNPFERMPQFSEWTLLVGERMSQYFERMLMYFERICKPFERFVERFERIFLGGRTDNERFTCSNG